MSETKKDKVILRCPYCFSNSIDVYLHWDGEVYYCLRCSFTGDKNKIMQMYEGFKEKYLLSGKRITLEEQR